jgi:hypothetical protein
VSWACLCPHPLLGLLRHPAGDRTENLAPHHVGSIYSGEYDAAWVHGLLLAFMHRRASTSRRGRGSDFEEAEYHPHGGGAIASLFNRRRGTEPLVSSLRPLLVARAVAQLSLGRRWDIAERAQQWCFVGQAFSHAQELHDAAEIMTFRVPVRHRSACPCVVGWYSGTIQSA